MELLFIVIVLCVFSIVFVGTAGWFLTAKARYNHIEEMERINEEKKLNALTIRERNLSLDSAQYEQFRSLSAGSSERVFPQEQFPSRRYGSNLKDK